MTTVELKSILTHQIAEIDDKSFLLAIKKIIDTKSEKTVYKTTAEQRKIITEGRAQIARGESVSNEQLENDIDAWLNEK